jgi:hypothetical protein
MNSNQFGPSNPMGEEEPAGAERYLHPGEELRICSTDIQIKKFMFEAYLTNRRLFLIDQSDRKPGVTAKEILVESIIGSYLEDSPSREPVIVLSVKTTDDDIRTMKMTFTHNGEERTTEAEEWIHFIAHATSASGETVAKPKAPGLAPTPYLSPEARALSDTMVSSSPQPEPVLGKKETKAPARRQPPPDASSPLQTPESPSFATTPIQFCFHCGKKLPPNANFCPYCGTKVHQSAHIEEQPHSGPPLHQYQEQSEKQEAEMKKRGWKRLFGR